MSTIRQLTQLTILGAAAMVVYGPAALAEDTDIDALTKPESSISVGAGYWSSDRPQEGIYDGMRDDGGYLLLDGDVVTRDDETGTWNSITVRNLGLDSREIELEHERQGDYGISLEFNQTPREAPYDVETGLLGIGTVNQLISGSGANALPSRNVLLRTERDKATVEAFKTLLPNLSVNMKFQNEEKDGTRHWGLGSQPYFLVEPIDSTTRQLELSLNYVGDRFQAAGGYYGSWYENDESLVFGLVNGAAQPGSTQSPNPTPVTLPLDNRADQLFVDFGYDFTSTTRATLKASYTHATQDEELPTWALAPPNDRFVNAPSSLDGEINTTVVQLGLSSHLTRDLSLRGNLRYEDMQDDTPLAGFVGDNTTGDIDVHNTPHSIQTLAGKVEGTYRLPMGFSVIGGIDEKQQDRSYPLFEAERFVPFRSELDETTYRVQLRRSLSATINGSIAFLHSERDGSEYLPTEHFPSDLINPIHIADRDRDKWRLTLDWTPNTALSVQFNYEDSQDDYGLSAARPYGLRDGSAMLASLDAVYTFNPNWQATAWYSHDKTEATEFGGRWDRVSEIHEVDKLANLKDTGDAIGLGLRGKVNPRFHVGADLQWVRSRAEYPQQIFPTGLGGLQDPYPTSGGVTATELPDIENKLTRLNLYAQYGIQKSADVRLDLIYERWRTDDWTWRISDGSPFVYGSTEDGTMVINDPRQTSTFVGVRYIYRFQ